MRCRAIEQRLRYLGSQRSRFVSLSSSAREPCVSFGVASASSAELRSALLDFAEVCGRELQGGAAQVLLQALELGRAGDRNDPPLLREEPRECDLRRRRALSRGDRGEQLDEHAVRLARLALESRERRAEVALVEVRRRVDASGKKALP